MGKEVKTNAVRILERNKVPYELLTYECDEFIDGIHSAEATGTPVAQTYKTLVMQGKSKKYYVFVIPIAEEVDLKAAARAVSEKSVEMIHVKDLTAITGYVRGGCSTDEVTEIPLCFSISIQSDTACLAVAFPFTEPARLMAPP
mgnify:CR=1 FL=1